MKRMEFRYKGIGGCDCICDVTISRGDTPVVVFHQRTDSTGTSVTNWSEHLAKEILNDYLVGFKYDEVLWFEHYDDVDTWDKITYDERGLDCSNPRWSSVSQSDVEFLIKVNESNKGDNDG